MLSERVSETGRAGSLRLSSLKACFGDLCVSFTLRGRVKAAPVGAHQNDAAIALGLWRCRGTVATFAERWRCSN
jgi:hypothetical protein